MKPVELVWTGGEHPFLLRIGELRALQQKCDAGPMFILTRLLSGGWYVDDVVETIRLGLIGGGMDQTEARKLVNQYVGDGAYQKNVVAAAAILQVSIMGDEDDPVGEPVTGMTNPQTESGNSPNSMQQGQPSEKAQTESAE